MFDFFKKKSAIKVECEVKKQIEKFDNIADVAKYFQSQTGVTFDKQISVLNNKVISFCRQRCIYSFDELLSKINYDEALKQELIDYLTTNETFFYRELSQIYQLTKLIKIKNSYSKILCAPSSTGEEPYSIAIALLEEGVSTNRFEIVGIDINSHAIALAKNGIYAQRNIRNLDSTILEKYFHKSGDNYKINDSIKSLVRFEIANIFDPSFKNIGKFDYIFSRNMLIYFDKETKLRAKKILEDLRVDQTQEIFFGHADLF